MKYHKFDVCLKSYEQYHTNHYTSPGISKQAKTAILQFQKMYKILTKLMIQQPIRIL